MRVSRKETKDQRLEVRATSRQTNLISEAAQATGKTFSAFLLDSAYSEAHRVLADRRIFELDPASWEAFMEALDRPAQDRPRLRKLMQSPSVLEDE